MKVIFELDSDKEAGTIELMHKVNDYYTFYLNMVCWMEMLRSGEEKGPFTALGIAEEIHALMEATSAVKIYFPEDN